MTRANRFLRCYADADWIARLVLTTCFAAALNFAEIFSHSMAAAASGVCYLGPPAAFYPRFLVLAGLLIATPAAFKRTPSCRLTCGIGLTVSLGTFIYWWLESYRVFRNFEKFQIAFLNSVEIRQAAYLYQATFLDLGVALSLLICLVIVLDRLVDGEKS